MGDFSNFHGYDGYPHGLSMEYLRQAQWAFGGQFSGMNGHTGPGRLPPFSRYEDAYTPRRPQGHQFPGEPSRFQTFFEHPFGRFRPSARPSRYDPQGDRSARYPRPYMRPGVQDNISEQRQVHRHNPSLPFKKVAMSNFV